MCRKPNAKRNKKIEYINAKNEYSNNYQISENPPLHYIYILYREWWNLAAAKKVGFNDFLAGLNPFFYHLLRLSQYSVALLRCGITIVPPTKLAMANASKIASIIRFPKVLLKIYSNLKYGRNYLNANFTYCINS